MVARRGELTSNSKYHRVFPSTRITVCQLTIHDWKEIFTSSIGRQAVTCKNCIKREPLAYQDGMRIWMLLLIQDITESPGAAWDYIEALKNGR